MCTEFHGAGHLLNPLQPDQCICSIQSTLLILHTTSMPDHPMTVKYACKVFNVNLHYNHYILNKQSKNFDKRTHCPYNCHTCSGWVTVRSSTLPWCAVPCGLKSAAPYCCSICCLHSLMHFDGGTTPKSAPCHSGTWPPPNTWFLRPTQVHNQNGISTGSATFVGFTVDKHTHTQTTSLH